MEIQKKTVTCPKLCTTERIYIYIYNHNNIIYYLILICFSEIYLNFLYVYFAARFCEHKSVSRLLIILTYLGECVYCPTHKCTHIDTCMVCVLRPRKICAAISRCVCCFRIKMKYICVTVNIIAHCVTVFPIFPYINLIFVDIQGVPF